jgi:hypothetical protein
VKDILSHGWTDSKFSESTTFLGLAAGIDENRLDFAILWFYNSRVDLSDMMMPTFYLVTSREEEC